MTLTHVSEKFSCYDAAAKLNKVLEISLVVYNDGIVLCLVYFVGISRSVIEKVLLCFHVSYIIYK